MDAGAEQAKGRVQSCSGLGQSLRPGRGETRKEGWLPRVSSANLSWCPGIDKPLLPANNLFCLLVIETRFLCVSALAVLELAFRIDWPQTKTSSCFHLPSYGIKGVATRPGYSFLFILVHCFSLNLRGRLSLHSPG